MAVIAPCLPAKLGCRYDAVRCIVMVVMEDSEELGDGGDLGTRILVYEPLNGGGGGGGAALSGSPRGVGLPPDRWPETFREEAALLEAFMQAVVDLDPDVVVGYDLQKESLGFLAERAQALDVNLLRRISRTPGVPSVRERMDDEWGRMQATGLHCTGRILLNLWRVLRSEVKLTSYSLEACAAAVLRLRVPHIPHHQLAAWFDARAPAPAPLSMPPPASPQPRQQEQLPPRAAAAAGAATAAEVHGGASGPTLATHAQAAGLAAAAALPAAPAAAAAAASASAAAPAAAHAAQAAPALPVPLARWRVMAHLRRRCTLCLRLMDTLDLVGRTAEMARTFGIDFFSVITRCDCDGGVYIKGYIAKIPLITQPEVLLRLRRYSD